TDRRVSVGSFDEYLEDVDALLEQVVNKYAKTDKKFLFAHSMGGAVGALYLEKHPEMFRCAVLASPMLKMDYGAVPDRAIGLMAVYSDVVNNDEQYAPGQGAFTGESDLKNSSAMDRDRYEYQFSQRLEDKDYQTYGGTWGWVKAARIAAADAVKNAGEIRTPVLVLQAGEDNMVDITGQNEFRDKSEYVSLINYPGSRHELFNASKEIREEFFRDLLSYYSVF
ncbi:MAG: lysophospholipase, partial [Solobacterium sp.]|nr:lysophospholipase [Solobacterium sp.]